MGYQKAKTRDLFSALHDLHKVQRNTPKDTDPETIGWLMREMRDELGNRGFYASSEDALHDGHSFDLDPDEPYWIDVYPLLGISDYETRDRVEDLFRLYYFKRCGASYDCSGEVFTIRFHVFKRRGAWWVYETLTVDC